MNTQEIKDLCSTQRYLLLKRDQVVQKLASQVARRDVLGKAAEDLQLEVEDCKLAQEFYQKVVNLIYDSSVGEMKRVVDEALEYIFYDKKYRLKMDLTERYGKSLEWGLEETREDGTCKELDLKDGTARGVRTIVSFVIQFYYLMSKDSYPLMCIDESYDGVSVGYLERFVTLLKKLGEEKGLTLVLITHDPRMQEVADYKYEVVAGRVKLLEEPKH